VSRPFSWEGRKRENNARVGIDQLMEAAATLIVIPNDNLLPNLPEEVTCEEAFKAADDVLRQGVQGITDLITRPGIINLDFEDARTVLAAGGRAVMGMGSASGTDRALSAAEKAAHNPLLEDASISGAKAILINFTSDHRLGLKEVQMACDFVREKAHPEVNVLFGTSIDEKVGEELRVTVVAAAFESAEMKVLKRPAFQSQPIEAVAGALGVVPGVDGPLPSAVAAASPPSTGFLRGVKSKSGIFSKASEIFPAAGMPGGKNYEEYQTPPFLRKSRD
jgi:cell division protein FtsZ